MTEHRKLEEINLKKVHAGIINQLETALEKARKGEVTWLALAHGVQGEYDSVVQWNGIRTPRDTKELVASVETLKFSVLLRHVRTT